MYGIDNLPRGAYAVLPTRVTFGRYFSSFSVESLLNNCSHLCMTNMDFYRRKESKTLVKTFVNWAYRNNYTKVFATMSSNNMDKIELLKKWGFTSIGRPYKSRRTGNTIYWLQGDLTKMKELLK